MPSQLTDAASAELLAVGYGPITPTERTWFPHLQRRITLPASGGLAPRASHRRPAARRVRAVRRRVRRAAARSPGRLGDDPEPEHRVDRRAAKDLGVAPISRGMPTNFGSPQELLTREETARLLRQSLPTLGRIVKSGRLTPVRIGRRVLFDPGDVRNFIQSSKAARP